MRVTFFTPTLTSGGAERFTANLANKLSENPERQVFIVSTKKRSNEYDVSSKIIRYNFLQIKKNILGSACEMRAFLQSNQIDVAVGMGIYSCICLCLANVALDTAVVVSERNAPGHVKLHWTTIVMRKLLLWRADYHIFQTPKAQAAYSKYIQSRSRVIHNPVKEDLPKKTAESKEEIVAVGRLVAQKNYSMLLQATSIVHQRHPSYVLRIFGQGPLEDALKREAKDLGIHDHVVFEGFNLNVHDKMRNASIYVLSSDYEGMPNALMEAMAMGFPVVSTDCPSGGPAELIEDGVNGLLTPVGDAAALANAIIRLIEDKKLRRRLAEQALHINETHSLERIAGQWERMLGDIRRSGRAE